MNAESKQSDQHNSETESLDNYHLKDCFVRVQKLTKRTLEMEEQKPVVRKRGRPSKAAQGGTASPALPKTPAPKPKPSLDKMPAKKVPFKKRASAGPNLIIETEDGGRSRRTPKPNPRYMDEEASGSATKQLIKDESMSETEEDDDVHREEADFDKSVGDDSAPAVPGKRRGRPPKIKKLGPFKTKSADSTPVTAVKKPTAPATVPVKRKIAETDIDVDDDRAKQLFLDAKRRLTQVGALPFFLLHAH